MNNLMVRLNKTIHAPIENVFDAWLDPATLSRFILPMPGMPEPETENRKRSPRRWSVQYTHGGGRGEDPSQRRIPEN
jgi:uncharacterized protein YndB with AHSA1/START domain